MLNNDQQNAAHELNNFLNSDEKEFCLTGQAGTGKSYMLHHILGDKAIYCATTNKAASVLRLLTGSADTIHSLLSLTVRNDFKTGKTYLTRNPRATAIRKAIIVIDEASMIDKHLYKIIEEMCSESKIIYVGDDAQLPPVQGGVFSVFNKGISTISLTQVMRSIDTPVITNLSTALRAGVFNGHNIHISEQFPSIVYLSGGQAFEKVNELVKSGQWRNCVLLSYTNARAIEATGAIRRAADKPIDLLPGDSVIVNSAFKVDDGYIQTDSILVIKEIFPINGSEDLIMVSTDIGDFLTYRDNSKLQQLITAASSAKDWPEYFRLKETYIDLRHAEALTIHKSQGSTFDTVFVDIGSLANCQNPNTRRRLLYVACSRARNQLFLVK